MMNFLFFSVDENLFLLSLVDDAVELAQFLVRFMLVPLLCIYI